VQPLDLEQENVGEVARALNAAVEAARPGEAGRGHRRGVTACATSIA
jgi:hypothetical protein